MGVDSPTRDYDYSREYGLFFYRVASGMIASTMLSRAGIGVCPEDDKDTRIVVHDTSFYIDLLKQGSIGLGDSYVDGKWDSQQIDEVVFRILSSGIYQEWA